MTIKAGVEHSLIRNIIIVLESLFLLGLLDEECYLQRVLLLLKLLLLDMLLEHFCK